MKKMNGKMNNISRKSAFISGYTRSGLIRKSGNALIMIVLMFAMLLVLGTGAVTLASSTSRRAINETKKEQAYIAARSVSMAIKDQIVNTTVMSDRVALIDKLNESFNTGEAVAINSPTSGTYTDINYELLPVEALSSNFVKYTIRATYSGVSEDYSFVLSCYSLPSPSSTLAFMTANNVSSMTNVNIINNYTDINSMIIDGKSSPGQIITLKSRFQGDLYLSGNVKLEDGFMIDGDLIIKGDLGISGNATVNGNIYLSGRADIQNGTINGSVLTNYIPKNKNDNHQLKVLLGLAESCFYAYRVDSVDKTTSTIVKNINLSENDLMYIDYTHKMQEIANYASTVSNDSSIPSWAIWKNNTYTGEVATTISGRDLVISSSGNLTANIINTLNNSTSIDQLVIDAKDSNEVNRIDLYMSWGGNTVEVQKPIRTRGHVYFYISDNSDIRYTQNAPVIPTDDYRNQPLRTFLIGQKNNKIEMTSSFYGYIYLDALDNQGFSSNSRLIDIQGTNYGDFDKFHGLMIAQNLDVHPSSLSDFVIVDPYEDSADGSAGSGYQYAGIIR